jgi:putative acetyltransferase
MAASGPDGIGHMEQIAVHPASFGSGVGARLLEAAKVLCPTGLTLRVNQENPRAVAFYRRAGFVVTAEGVNPGGRRPVFDMAWRPLGAGSPAVTRPERP